MTDERDAAKATRDRSTYRCYRRQDGTRWRVQAVNPGHSYDVWREGGDSHHVLAATCDAALTEVLRRNT
jgi:hypothetical protein